MAGFDKTYSASDVITITPNDTNDCPILRAIRANSAGVIKVLTQDSGSTVRTLRFTAGERQDVIIKRVLATGTTVPGTDIDGYL